MVGAMTQMRRRTGAICAAVALAGAVLVTAGPTAAQGATCFGRAVTISAVAGQVTVGTSGPDVIMGTSGPDVIRGGGGADRICSLGGSDTVFGGGGNDRINLGKGHDTAFGGKGADRILGQAGRDTIDGNGGADDLAGGAGADVIRGGKKGDTIAGGNGSDDLSGNAGPDTIRGGKRNDFCAGGSGADELFSCNEAATAGQYRVGAEIPPGRYQFANARAGCFWQRLSGFGGDPVVDVISSGIQSYRGPAVIDILPTDAGFEFERPCRTLQPYRAPGSPATSFGRGTYVVGSDIAAGTYRAQAEPGCFWKRVAAFTNRSADEIARGNVVAGGQVTVTIEATDVGFQAEDECGRWSRIGS